MGCNQLIAGDIPSVTALVEGSASHLLLDYRQGKAAPSQRKRLLALVAMETKLVRLGEKTESDERNQERNDRGALWQGRKETESTP